MRHRDAVKRGAIVGLLIAMGIAFLLGIVVSPTHDPLVGLNAVFLITLVMGVIWGCRWFFTRFL